jgi:hypothetical protein
MRHWTGVRRPRLEHMSRLSWFEAFAGAERSGAILNLAEGMVALRWTRQPRRTVKSSFLWRCFGKIGRSSRLRERLGLGSQIADVDLQLASRHSCDREAAGSRQIWVPSRRECLCSEPNV